MLFNSIEFLLFFPVAAIFYFLLPQKVKWLWLLACSLYFYAQWKASYLILIIFSVVVTYAGARIIDTLAAREGQGTARLRKAVLVLTLLANLGVLFLFKYYNFFARTVAATGVQLPLLRYALPVGISFYTFQALGYVIDVYWGSLPAEKNMLRYMLFVTFFPQLVAGPIERASNLLPQFYEKHAFDYERMRSGLLLMGWGLFQKIVIADRLTTFVDKVYADYASVDGIFLLLAVVLFSFQIYCDFAGYSNIAVGTARIMGFKLMLNFDAPYLSHTLAEFWSRWHISLSTWLQDYIFTPLVWSRWTSRVPVLRRYVQKPPAISSLLIVFFVSGLWHGANWTFIVWGLLHGVCRAVSQLTLSKRAKLRRRLGIRAKARWYRALQVVFTFSLVTAIEVFFRAQSLGQAVGVLRRIGGGLNAGALFTGKLFEYGLSPAEWVVALCALCVLWTADVLTARRVDVQGWIFRRGVCARWAIYLGIILVLVLFGVYGPAYDAAPFIYFQF